MTVEAYAKVNLTLAVYGKRPDGYHALRSIVQPIALADTLEIEPTDDGLVSSDTGYGENDLIVRAARALVSRSRAAGTSRLPCTHGCRVRVTKRIPAGGGLGGGSADAAAALNALNALWRLGKSPEELADIGAAVGSDVPALVLAQHYRRPVLMEGRGEKVSVLGRLRFPLRGLPLVLANPGVHSSTPEVFAHCTPRVSDATGAAFSPRESGDVLRLFNDLQEAAIALHPDIDATLEALRSLGARETMMSGSGATVFGFVETDSEAERLVKALQARGFSAWCSRML